MKKKNIWIYAVFLSLPLFLLSCATPIGKHMGEKVVPSTISFAKDLGPGIVSALWETLTGWMDTAVNEVEKSVVDRPPGG